MKALSILVATAALAGGAWAASAQDSLGDSLAASGASVNVGADLAASGVRTASAAAVLPIGSIAAGSAVAGSVVGGTGGAALLSGARATGTAAGQLAGFAVGPLPVTRDVVVAPQPVPHVPYAPQGQHP